MSEGPNVAPGPASELPPPPTLRDFTKVPLVIIAAMFVFGALAYARMPDVIPTHWGVSGAPDAFAAKSLLSVFFMPLMTLALYGLLVWVPMLDPLRRSLRLSLRAYNVIIDVFTAFMAVVYAATVMAAFNAGFDVTRVILVALGLLFGIIGYYMQDVRQNWTFGVRVSWTLSDEVVWTKTNLLGGRLFMAAGVITALSAFLQPQAGLAVMLTTIAAMLLVTYGYAYLLYRRRHPEA